MEELALKGGCVGEQKEGNRADPARWVVEYESVKASQASLRKELLAEGGIEEWVRKNRSLPGIPENNIPNSGGSDGDFELYFPPPGAMIDEGVIEPDEGDPERKSKWLVDGEWVEGTTLILAARDWVILWRRACEEFFPNE